MKLTSTGHAAGLLGAPQHLTIPDEDQAGLVGGFSILQLEGVSPFILLLQFIHDHFHQACLLVHLHLVFLQEWEQSNH